jgi:hypothetical protein
MLWQTPLYVCVCRLVHSRTMATAGVSGTGATVMPCVSSSRALTAPGLATLHQHCAAAPTSTPAAILQRLTGATQATDVCSVCVCVCVCVSAACGCLIHFQFSMCYSNHEHYTNN